MRKMNDVIGFAGKMRSGKTEAALSLVRKYGYVKLSAATALKSLCAKLIGVDLETLNNLKNDKDAPLLDIHTDKQWYTTISETCDIDYKLVEQTLYSHIFTNVRQILQVVGTDVIRRFNEDWHVKQLKKEIINHLGMGDKVVVDDIRFENELNLIKELGGTVYYIIRHNYHALSNHESENSLNENMFNNEHIIYNSQDIDYLNRMVEQKIRGL